jgi:cytochrome d ubiquinol oxidase subunit II
VPSIDVVLAAVILVALTVYALGAGADFGGGVWDLFASGLRAERQRRQIAHAIGPIWEANHVWLILVIVLLFVCFPPAFAAIATALHVPLTVMLLGIVARGSAFAFRSYGDESSALQRRWSRVFAIASLITPITLGVCVGAVASGAIHWDPATGGVQGGFFASWLRPFPFVIGLMALSLFAMLAAVYLTVEAKEEPLREDFRRRALLAAVAVEVCVATAFVLAAEDAPRIRAGLTGQPWSVPFHAVTAASAIGVVVALWRRRFRTARALAIAQTALVIWGWALSQFPYLVEPDLTIANSAAEPRVLRLVLGALIVGGVLLLPSLGYLYWIFKRPR